jgi:hypothetical protein
VLAPGGVPELKVNKAGFALGEDIVFFLNLKGLTDQQTNTLFDSGVVGHLEITPPDGKMTTSPVYLCYGYTGTRVPYVLGPNKIPKQHVVPGRYTLTFLYAGNHSKTVTVTATDLPVLKQIQVSLHLEGASGFPQCLATTQATLTVQNNTAQIVRFARLSEMDGMTFSVHCYGASDDSGTSFGSPVGAVGFSWDTITDRSGIVIIKPGTKYEQKISLKPALEDYLDYHKNARAVVPGQYGVTLGRDLYIFIGNRHDARAEFFPVYLMVTARAEFTAQDNSQN